MKTGIEVKKLIEDNISRFDADMTTVVTDCAARILIEFDQMLEEKLDQYVFKATFIVKIDFNLSNTPMKYWAARYDYESDKFYADFINRFFAVIQPELTKNHFKCSSASYSDKESQFRANITCELP
jgi:hypothetical protein